MIEKYCLSDDNLSILTSTAINPVVIASYQGDVNDEDGVKHWSNTARHIVNFLNVQGVSGGLNSGSVSGPATLQAYEKKVGKFPMIVPKTLEPIWPKDLIHARRSSEIFTKLCLEYEKSNRSYQQMLEMACVELVHHINKIEKSTKGNLIKNVLVVHGNELFVVDVTEIPEKHDLINHYDETYIVVERIWNPVTYMDNIRKYNLEKVCIIVKVHSISER